MSNKTVREVIIDTINNFPLNMPTSDGKQFGVTVGDRLPIETATLIAKKISKDLYTLLKLPEKIDHSRQVTICDCDCYQAGIASANAILKTKLEVEG